MQELWQVFTNDGAAQCGVLRQDCYRLRQHLQRRRLYQDLREKDGPEGRDVPGLPPGIQAALCLDTSWEVDGGTVLSLEPTGAGEEDGV